MVLMRRITVQGFVSGDRGPNGDWATLATVRPVLQQYVREGRVRFEEDVQEGGLENYIPSLRRLFSGENTGKLMLRLF
jgi:NADPH-dependent curcumin reductase CurA